MLSVHIAHGDNSYELHLIHGTPNLFRSLCLATHRLSVPLRTPHALKRATGTNDDVTPRHAKSPFLAPDTDPSGQFHALVGTTQASDLVRGGVKANALLESAWAIVNHRIATDGTSVEVKVHERDNLSEVPERFHSTLRAFGEDVHGGMGYGVLEVKTARDPMEPGTVTGP